MDLRREFLLSFGVLLLLNTLLAFGAIGLFARMSPAIDRILQENVYSIVAVEEMLAELAVAGNEPVGEAGEARLREAIDRTRANITEPEEPALVAILDEELEALLGGAAAPRERFVEAARELIRVNREAMRAADGEARRLGQAGAWAAALVGIGFFGLSLLLVARLRRRLLQPLAELHAVVEAVLSGDRYRRASRMGSARELRQLLEGVNRLLDERVAGGKDPGLPPLPGDPEEPAP